MKNLTVLLCTLCVATFSAVVSAATKPNIIIFFSDDTGYGDFSVYGHPVQEAGDIDRMAEEGMRFTQWYSAALICSPSRAALLTGRYARRSGIYGNRNKVFSARSSGGLPKSETTIAEALQDAGYTTGMVGKWHLGINKDVEGDGIHLPDRHGFDFLGINLPLSQTWACDANNTVEDQWKLCFLYNGTSIIEQPINLKTMTQRLVDDALEFITANSVGPFFLYFSFPQTHGAMFCDDRFCGTSKRDETNGYGDNINEMAWAVGTVLNKTKELGIENDTLAIYTSDHGAPADSCRHDGSNLPFRGGKATTWEGGFRVPAIAWWPNTIPANTVSDTFVNTLDVFPTAMYLAGKEDYQSTYSGVIFDGQPIREIAKYRASTPSDLIDRNSTFYYCSNRLMAVRIGDYKVHYFTMGELASSSSTGCGPSSGLDEDFSCFGENITVWSPPLVINVVTNVNETVQEDPVSAATLEIVSDAAALVADHEATFSGGEARSQLDRAGSASLIPCCALQTGGYCSC